MNPTLNIAVRAARSAGDQIIRYVDRIHTLDVSKKNKNDFVSKVDKEAEDEIISILRKSFPDHAILAEESGDDQIKSDYQWIIDPLDGTTNFLHGFPQFSVSIALKVKGRIEQAVVYDPLKQEMFCASKGQGATMNDRKIRLDKSIKLNDALLGTGFPYRDQDRIDTYMNIFKDVSLSCIDHRRAGSAALDLAYVAAGRLGGFWEMGLKPWDMAAGVLLIRESGGIVGDFEGGDDYMKTGDIVAGNNHVFSSLVKIIKSHS